MPQSKREEEFFKAIEVIKSAIRQGLVMKGYDKSKPVDTVFITTINHGTTYDIEDADGYHKGYGLDSAQLSIVEPEEILKRNREAAQKKYDEVLKAAAYANQALESARKAVADLDDKLVKPTRPAGFFDKMIVCTGDPE